MTKEFLRKFLNYQSKTDLLSECKIECCLYFAFTIIFVDGHFLITSGISKGDGIWLFINAVLTALIVPMFIVYKIYKKKSVKISQIFLLGSIINFCISIDFFYLLLLKCIKDSYVLSAFHFSVILVMISLMVLALCYRQRRLKKEKSRKQLKKQIYIAIYPLGLGVSFCLRLISKNSDIKNDVLSCSLIFLASLFLIIASVDFQNFIICKRYNFEG